MAMACCDGFRLQLYFPRAFSGGEGFSVRHSCFFQYIRPFAGSTVDYHLQALTKEKHYVAEPTVSRSGAESLSPIHTTVSTDTLNSCLTQKA